MMQRQPTTIGDVQDTARKYLSNGDIEKNDFEKLGGLQNYSSHF